MVNKENYVLEFEVSTSSYFKEKKIYKSIRPSSRFDFQCWRALSREFNIWFINVGFNLGSRFIFMTKDWCQRHISQTNGLQTKETFTGPAGQAWAPLSAN